MTKVKGVRINYPTVKKAVLPFYDNFSTSLPAYSAKYEISPAEEAIINAHNSNLDTLLAQQTAARNAAQQATQAFDEELVAAEIDAKRVMKKIKEHASFVRSDGEAMGFLVEGPEFDPDTSKPVISGVTSLMDKIVINYVKKKMKGVVIYVNKRNVRNPNMQEELKPTGLNIQPIPANLQWEILDKDQQSPYEDKRKNLTLLPEIRYYKLRYLWKKDKEVGYESDIVKVVAEIY